MSEAQQRCPQDTRVNLPIQRLNPSAAVRYVTQRTGGKFQPRIKSGEHTMAKKAAKKKAKKKAAKRK